MTWIRCQKFDSELQKDINRTCELVYIFSASRVALGERTYKPVGPEGRLQSIGWQRDMTEAF